jgi:hypothetical protein
MQASLAARLLALEALVDGMQEADRPLTEEEMQVIHEKMARGEPWEIVVRGVTLRVIYESPPDLRREWPAPGEGESR